jgi:hypothetical protein
MIAAPRPQRVDEKERGEALLSHGIPVSSVLHSQFVTVAHY